MRNNDRLMIICGTVVIAVAIASSAAVTSVRALASSDGSQSEQGDTVVYITQGQGSQGVPVYSIPESTEQAETGELLPNFTPVSMVCYQDAKVERFFYVRVGDESPVRPGEVVVVRADDTHNQRIVDEC